jgi:hypothetical protein
MSAVARAPDTEGHTPMSSVISSSRRRARLLALTGALLAGSAVAPAAQAAVSNPYSCSPSPQAVSQVFLPFGDTAQYTPVQNAGLESGSTGWTLSSGAAVVNDQEPWNVSGVAGSHALDLPNGSAAVTAPICIDATYPYFRFFAKNVNANNAGLEVEVLYYDSKGRIQKESPVTYTSPSAGWQPSSKFNITVFGGTTTTTAAPVAFRFVPMGGTAHYVIDDVYVDPWSRG